MSIIRKGRKNNPARILSTSESKETDEPEIQIDTPSGIKWTSKKHSPKIHDFTPQHSGVVGNNLNRSARILDYLQFLISEYLIKFIVEKSNNYWRRQLKRDHLEVSEATELNELYCFIAASLLMTQNKQLSLKEYWSKDKLFRSDIFSKIMSRNCCLSLLKMMHFTDIVGHTTEGLYKTNEVVEMHLTMHFSHTIDYV
ncbi:hypothetical protein AVEN_116758-1 [Araneus ventricosus]|uniref:PiggyBac transposable element-derived protein domain-containing protein n=1 Tax=Araneus ventricosus TaxID=182803 RepID=A0A4Y2QAW4_ARAVE|nr:hypothetical protein AVEN_116758-1 [Araneus ventricosus]